MAVPVLIIGASGSGKTYSLRNFKSGEIGVMSVEKGRLPFRSNLKAIKVPTFEGDPRIKSPAQISVARYSWIESAIKNGKSLSYAIDDSQYLLVDEVFDRINEKSYDKFSAMALNFRNLIHNINNLSDDNKIVYFLHHSEMDANNRYKAKTIGKMLDNVLTVEGCFDIVLYCEDYKFYTQNNAVSTAKSPEGMFETLEIPNDLKAVDTAIRNYYGLSENNKEGKEKG